MGCFVAIAGGAIVGLPAGIMGGLLHAVDEAVGNEEADNEEAITLEERIEIYKMEDPLTDYYTDPPKTRDHMGKFRVELDMFLVRLFFV